MNESPLQLLLASSSLLVGEQVEAVSSLATIFHAAVKGRATSLYSDCFRSTQAWPRTYERRKSRPREDAAAAPSSPADENADDNVCMKKQRRSGPPLPARMHAHHCPPPRTTALLAAASRRRP